MMERLIDADELIEIIEGNENLIELQKEELVECVNACDIAYDVDKVVKALENEKNRAFKLCLATNDAEQRKQYIVKEQAMELAIEIVKAGGID